MKVNRKNKKIVLFFGLPISLSLLLLASLLIFVTLFEYRPAPKLELEIMGEAKRQLISEDELEMISWNIGYLALDEKADFFMDGGKMVRGSSRETILNNLKNIVSEIKERKPDFVLLQEVDKKSYRSFDVDEIEGIMASLSSYEGSYARNFKALFVPFPFPPIRHVDAGLLTLSSYDVKEAQRLSLPSPFNWPVKTVNLKRCLLINRLPIKNSKKEIVLLNLHLEAYDDTGGAFLQFAEMMRLMEAEVSKGNYVIAGGDFNQTFSHIEAKGLGSHGEKSWKPGIIETADKSFNYLMDGERPSCRSLERPYERTEDFPKYVIDGFILSKNLEVMEFKTLSLDFKHSDHNPVYLKVRLK